MRGQFDDDDENEEIKKELVIPKYILLYQDMEVEIKQDLQEEKDEMQEKEEEEKKVEENPEESGEEGKKNLKPMERIIQYVAEIMAEGTEAKPISDKEMAEKLKRRLDLDIDLIKPSVSNEDIEENGETLTTKIESASGKSALKGYLAWLNRSPLLKMANLNNEVIKSARKVPDTEKKHKNQ